MLSDNSQQLSISHTPLSPTVSQVENLSLIQSGWVQQKEEERVHFSQSAGELYPQHTAGTVCTG